MELHEHKKKATKSTKIAMVRVDCCIHEWVKSFPLFFFFFFFSFGSRGCRVWNALGAMMNLANAGDIASFVTDSRAFFDEAWEAEWLRG